MAPPSHHEKISRTLAFYPHSFGMAHISDHDLERYYLGMIAGDSAEEIALEEHLLGCPECAARAEANDRYVDAIQGAIIKGNFDLE